MKRLVILFAMLLVMPSAAMGQVFEKLVEVVFPGASPYSGLVIGNDGCLYGTTVAGGNGGGTIYRITSPGQVVVLHSFTGADGRAPYGELIEAADGHFYGTTAYGGSNDHGTIFRITKAGVHTVLHNFNGTDGSRPYAGLMVASDGLFYGTTQQGGATAHPSDLGDGTIFKISPSGVFASLHSLDYVQDGASPVARLVEGDDGYLYGTTKWGGSGTGSVFKISKSGAFSKVPAFDGYPGGNAPTGLIKGDSASFYGVMTKDSPSKTVTVFEMTPSGVVTPIASFDHSEIGYLVSGLVRGRDGCLYGTISGTGINLKGAIFKVTLGGTYEILHSFTGSDGSAPYGGLVQGVDGHFYGTTLSGGFYGTGTVFKFTSTGVMTTLHSFGGVAGSAPRGGLAQDAAGTFYGTTNAGGTHGKGTIFTLSKTGDLKFIRSFSGTDGEKPKAGLVLASNGHLYGTTSDGGASSLGTVFRSTVSGAVSVLHSFNGSDGDSPEADLIIGRDGNLYGTTYQGGAYYSGTIFRITPSGTLTSLSSLGRSVDAFYPRSDLHEGSDGTLFGATSEGGIFREGSVFGMAPNGAWTTIHSFIGANGSRPNAGPVIGSDGYLYGTTSNGGTNSRGTVYKISQSGELTTLHSFSSSDGAYPSSGLVQAADGSLYGTTNGDGIGSYGTVYKVSPTGTFVSVHSFGLEGCKHPGGKLVIGADGNIYGTALPMTVWRINLAANSNEPLLALPPSNSMLQGAAINVAFRLPEMPMPGSLRLTFGGIDLTLTSSLETIGSHVLSFNPLEPTSSPGIVGGAPIPNGTYSVVLTYQNTLGQTVTSPQAINVILDRAPEARILSRKHESVPNSGMPASGIPAGAVWHKLGVPAIGEGGQMALLGDWKVGTKVSSGVFAQSSSTGVPRLLAGNGAAVPGVGNAVFSAFKDPLVAADGAVVWCSSLANAPSTSAAVKTSNNTAVFLDADGSGPNPAVIVARKGDVAPGTTSAKWESFDSIAVSAESVVFLAKLVISSAAGVGAGSDQGLWIYHRDTATTSLLMRKGTPLLGSTVKVLSALTTRVKSGGQGRGVVSSSSEEQVALRVTLADGKTAVGVISSPGGVSFPYVSGASAVGYGAGALWQSFGLPLQNDPAGALCFLGTIKPGTGSATSSNNVAIFTEDDTTFTLTKRYGLRDSAGIGLFAGFSDPVSASGGALAFIGSMVTNSAAGITSSSNDGVWYDDGSGLELLARKGSQPPGVPTGARWASFSTVALPEGRGPIFVGKMVLGKGGITAGRDTGLWATDSAGAVKKLIQEGDAIGNSKVASFRVLSTVPGSPAQTRSFNSNGEVVMQVTDAAGGTHLLHVQVP